MTEALQAIQVADGVYWVGAIDWDVRDFHGYRTRRGTTYNAYLILADKVTLIDTVKSSYFDQMMMRIASVIDPRKIELVVSNHSEMDHSGCLTRTIHVVEPAEVFASKVGCKTLAAHFRRACQVTAVDDGQQLDLGNVKLSCFETRMCHWPDSMVSYLHERELLFSQDAFGMHLASCERFADELDRDILDREAAKYYANILLPLSSFVLKALKRLGDLGVPLSIVAPDHGPIWRTKEDIDRIIGDYARWAEQKPAKKAVVLHDTMWGSTAKMALAIGEGLAAAGATVKLMSARACHRSDVVAELLCAGALIVGSPTINNNVFPSVADVMTYIKGLRPLNLAGAAFGSYGWSGEAPRHLHAILKEMGCSVVAEPLRINYVPDEAALGRCRKLGERIAAQLRETCNG